MSIDPREGPPVHAELSATDLALFHFIQEQEEVTLADMCGFLGVSNKPARTRLDTLVQTGLVVRLNRGSRATGPARYAARYNATATEAPPPEPAHRKCGCSGNGKPRPIAYEVIAPAPTPCLWVGIPGVPKFRQSTAKPIVYTLCATCADYERQMQVPGVIIRPIEEEPA